MNVFRAVGALFLAVFMASCGGGSSGATGDLSVSLTDAATDQYNAIYVTVKEVAVHQSTAAEDGWSVVSTPGKTMNLLELVNGLRQDLGLVSLPVGHYTQMRLIIGDTADTGINILSQSHPFANYVIDSSGAYHELKVPSGLQSGVKIVNGFDISAGGTTELILDFNASKSVVVAGNGGKYLLQPTIKVLDTVEASIITGTVTRASDASVIAGAMVSAQTYNASAADVKDQVTVETATLTSDLGIYSLFIAAGTYNVVASKQGFSPSVITLTTTAGSTTAGQDFALAIASDGNMTGSATIADGDTETYVTISIRQSVSINGAEVVIEVASLNVVNGGTYSMILPAGTYTVVSSAFNHTTQQADVTVVAGADLTLNEVF